jgi:hypothetical protein
MRRDPEDSTSTSSAAVAAAYDAAVALAQDEGVAPEVGRMRAAFQKRTGRFDPEDPWFEARTRAFWDDALAGQGLAALAAPRLGEDARRLAARFGRAHRGLFEVRDVDRRGARLVDVWSGAELVVRHLDEAQELALEHAEGLVDARVIAASGDALFVLPGAFHHAAEATEAALRVIEAGRTRGLATGDMLDALLRMELVFRASSRVKVAFAYRVDSLPRSA